MKTPEDKNEQGDETVQYERTLRTGRGSGSGMSAPSGESRVPIREGEEFGDYRIVRLLGRGGFGSVWEAESMATGRRIALKVLSEVRVEDKDSFQRFEREGKIAASINHPNCVYVFGAEEIDGVPTISMELIHGETLQDRLNRDGPMQVEEAVDTTLALIDGLEAAQRVGVVHRDIKPSNCYVDDGGFVKIGDFGLSTTFETDIGLTQTGAFIGTPVYASPEQVRGRDVDRQSDLYSLGATLYALLTGKAPFKGGGAGEVLARILSEPPVPFSSHKIAIPKGLQGIVYRLLEKEKEKRFSSYDDLRKALTPFGSGGITVAGLGRRVIANCIDFLFLISFFSISGAIVASDLFADLYRAPGREQAPLILISLSIFICYFALTEGVWGRSPGKRFLGLAVIGTDGSKAEWKPILVRTLLFVGITQAGDFLNIILGLSGVEIDPESNIKMLLVTLNALAILLIFTTMRKSNGFAGPHELLSRTRVVIRSAERRTLHAVSGGAPADSGSDFEVERFGPFISKGIIWRKGGESLLIGQDEGLEREVWIHRYDHESLGAPEELLFQSRATRLPWLQGDRGERGNWDAFGVPEGASLRDCVVSRGGIGWGDLRPILRDLAAEMGSRVESSGRTGTIGVDYVWVDSNGHARLLDFPLIAPSVERTDGERSISWRAFLAEVALFGLEGRETGGEVRLPRKPLPGHAVLIMKKLLAREGADRAYQTTDELVEELDRGAGRATRVTPKRRTQLNLVTGLIPAMLSLIIAGAIIAPVIPVQGSPWQSIMAWRGKLIRTVERIQSGDHNYENPAERERAIRQLLAHSWMMHTTTGTKLPDLSEEDRTFIEESARKFPAVTDTEITDARATIGWTIGRRLGGSLNAVGQWVLHWLALISLPSIVLAGALRGGTLFQMFGFELRTVDGNRAGRLRSLWRMVVAFSPVLIYWIVPVILHTGEVAEILERPKFDIEEEERIGGLVEGSKEKAAVLAVASMKSSMSRCNRGTSPSNQ